MLFSLLSQSGMCACVRRRRRERLTIVLYHGVDEPRSWGSYNYRGNFVTPDTFDQHLAYYKKHYVVLPLDEAVDMLYTGSLPPHALVITFDDGYKNNYTHAYPLLLKHGLPATFFVTTDFIDHHDPLWVDRLEYTINVGHQATRDEKIAVDLRERARLKALPHADRLRELSALEEAYGAKLLDFSAERAVYAPLTWDELREMSSHGILIGAHTRSHPILSSLTAASLADEIAGSAERVRQEVGAVSRVFAYPNGQQDDFDQAVIKAVRDAGFVAALTTLAAGNTTQTDRYTLGRYTLSATDSYDRFEVIVTGTKDILTSLIH